MAYSQAQQANAVREASLTGAIEDFDPVIKRAADYAERLEVICAKLFGPGPAELAKPTGDGSIPGSLIQQVNQRRSWIGEQLDRIERSVNTIERVL